MADVVSSDSKMLGQKLFNENQKYHVKITQHDHDEEQLQDEK